MPSLAWIPADAPPDHFPAMHHALQDPDGLLAAGGDLSPARLLAAYRRGIFPWYQDDQPILWWSPDPRAVIMPGELHLSRRLRRTLRGDAFELSVDEDYPAVVSACARLRSEGTWITAEMERAYLSMHELGHAHSVEAWQDDELAGGIYGLALGRVFFGESMFSARRDASKAALVRLVALMQEAGMVLLDCQVASGHLERLGSRLLPRARFTGLLDEHAGAALRFEWRRGREPSSRFAALNCASQGASLP